MAKWYGIEGIEFHYNGMCADPTITFEGITDDANIDVEGTMWERYTDEHEGEDDFGQHFERYMFENSDEVRDLIRMARGLIEF